MDVKTKAFHNCAVMCIVSEDMQIVGVTEEDAEEKGEMEEDDSL